MGFVLLFGLLFLWLLAAGMVLARRLARRRVSFDFRGVHHD
jgi:hypothetical protein